MSSGKRSAVVLPACRMDRPSAPAAWCGSSAPSASSRHSRRPARARRLELLDQISDGLLLAGSAHRPSLELVGREHSRHLRHALGTDRRSRDGRRLLRGSVEIGGRAWGGAVSHPPRAHARSNAETNRPTIIARPSTETYQRSGLLTGSPVSESPRASRRRARSLPRCVRAQPQPFRDPLLQPQERH